MSWKSIIFIAITFIGLRTVGNLEDKLSSEKEAHEKTAQELTQALEDGLSWKKSYENAFKMAETQKEAVQACMDREKLTSQAGQERLVIIQRARPRPQTKQEQAQVIDEETRKLAADRFNRPL